MNTRDLPSLLGDLEDLASRLKDAGGPADLDSRLGDALRASGINAADALSVQALYATAGQSGSHRIVSALRAIEAWLREGGHAVSDTKLTAEESCRQVLKSIADACDQESLARAGGYLFRYVQEETVLRDCGQRGVCRTPPGCARHWEERNRELVRENEVLRSNSDHLSSENAALSHQVDSMAMRIESLAEELAKPEDVRLREVLDALEGRAVIFDGLGARVGHLLDEMDEWIGRAGEAERLAEERLAHANQLQADIEAEQQGRLALRKRLGAREDETMGAFLERLATMAGVVPAEGHERGWQWRPTATDTAFAPPFGTIRQCRVCGCLVAGGPTACARCAEVGA